MNKNYVTQLEIDVKRKPGSRYKRVDGEFLTYGVYLSTLAKMTYIVISFHKLTANSKAFPSLNTIARLTNASRSSIIRAIKELENFGWIVKTKSKQTQLNKNNNTYNLKVPFETDDLGNYVYTSLGDKKIKVSPVSAKDGDNFRKSLVDKNFKYIPGEPDFSPYEIMQEKNKTDMIKRMRKRESSEEDDYDFVDIPEYLTLKDEIGF